MAKKKKKPPSGECTYVRLPEEQRRRMLEWTEPRQLSLADGVRAAVRKFLSELAA